MRARLALVGCAAVLVVLPGGTLGGLYVPPPGDAGPTWSPDGRRLAFVTGRSEPGLAVVSVESAAENRILRLSGSPYPDPATVALSPDWRWVARIEYPGTLLVVRFDGTDERALASAEYGKPAWSPDSRRVAFRAAGGALTVVDLDGNALVRLAAEGKTPAWSPDGTRIAYAGGLAEPGIHVVDANGRDDVLVVRGAATSPSWSPDGARIAFVVESAQGPAAIAVARADGSAVRRYAGLSPVSERLAWTRDGRAIVYERGTWTGLFRLDVATGGSRRLTRFGEMPSISPDGREIAFSGGGECRDRVGVYVATIRGARARRLTNDCRVVGTSDADVLRGTPLADVLVGLAGDDRLVANDPAYVGDTLLGGKGDDLLVGGYFGDLLRGGAGDDRLRGGAFGDTLYGGPGRDRLEGQGGRDRIYSRDGARDVVVCGTNRDRKGDLDKVWADRLDWVSRDCERVRRAR